jgi:2',3'-cyclic-nucleotide 2'-phosphodiesterase (5'-nucleotidase family)
MQIISPKKYIFLVLGCVAMLAGCNRFYLANSMAYQQVAIQQEKSKDTAIEHMLQPYAEKVSRQMSKVIGEVAVPLEKRLPESSLGNLMADAVKAAAEKLYGKKIDAAFINYGGIRTNQVPAGPLTLNAVFEMMPFDNQLVVQELPGNILQQFLDTVAARGGWPSAGVQYVISNKKATLVKIGEQAIDPAKNYTVANSDYVVNGGDNCTMLKAYPQDNKGFLVRDALIAYFTAITARGEKIFAQVENRVTNVH